MMNLNHGAPVSSTLNPTKFDPNDVPTAAPDVVVTRADHDVAKPQPTGKTAAAAAHKAADGVAGAKAPPVDTTFRAASAEPVKEGVGPSLGRRLMRGVIGMILTACVAGAVVLWQSHGDAVRQIVTKSVSPVIAALWSRVSPGDEQPTAAPEVQASAVPETSASQQPAENPSSSAASSAPPDAMELLHSLARELAHMRQDLDQMKGAIAELKATDEQMAREIAKASDRSTDKALEQALRPRVSMVSPPPPQAVAMAARRPQPLGTRSAQPRPVSVTPQVVTSYAARPADARAMAPPSSTSTPPMDISAPRPPSPLREQAP
jgi:TolA-binding protein